MSSLRIRMPQLGTVVNPAATIVWINVAGTWKEATPFIKASGTWKQATPFIKVASIWRPITFLLDGFPGAEMAFSLRKLRSAYTGSAIRVRRSSDSAEQDIGFVNNNLDESALTTFCGSSDGLVVTWYDQASNKDYTNATATEQPKIVDAGSVIKVNGKAAIRFDGSNDNLIGTAVNFNTSNYQTFVGKRASSGTNLIALGGSQYNFSLYNDNNYYLQASTAGYQTSNATDTSTAQLILTGLNNGSAQKIYKNANEVSSSFVSFTLGTLIFKIGQYGNIPQFLNGELQEIVFYNVNQESNRTGIETNMKTFYNVF